PRRRLGSVRTRRRRRVDRLYSRGDHRALHLRSDREETLTHESEPRAPSSTAPFFFCKRRAVLVLPVRTPDHYNSATWRIPSTTTGSPRPSGCASHCGVRSKTVRKSARRGHRAATSLIAY